MNIPITDSIMRIDTSRDNFNMQDIENRRFMFSPKTATLILGYQYRNGELVSSHADEYASTGISEPFDDFVRGWIGTSKEYTDGVIHFAPSVSEKISHFLKRRLIRLKCLRITEQEKIRLFVGSAELGSSLFQI